IEISGISVEDKVYDGDEDAYISGTAELVDVISGDDVHLNGSPVASFETKAAGDNIPVTIFGYELTGDCASNYNLILPIELTASITPRPVEISGVSVKDKVYDGTSEIEIITSDLTGVIDGDEVYLDNHTHGTLSQSGVGNSITVRTDMVLSGIDSDNYYFEQPLGITARVTPAKLIITANDTTKMENEPDPDFTVSYSGFVPGDGVGVVTDLEINRVQGEKPGDYEIIPSGAVAPNYNIRYQRGVLRIEQSVSVSNDRSILNQNEKGQYGITIFNNPVSRNYSRAEFNVRTPEASELQIMIYDALGNRLYAETVKTDPFGNSETIVWNLSNARGARVSIGTYLIRVVGYGRTTSQQYLYGAKLGVTDR
ncbi:YDG domain-containing protein, partial [Chitinispirillales bacterium ANBcel5]|uniref:YDG domain-containing protein n=1 Tax=Cellulosispirillum alkaliphilum TaxID=3039283 RepID=UPI002A5183C9|nr:YDG domain-containing protein [Chitinispirillales bacterium ANBcel5]